MNLKTLQYLPISLKETGSSASSSFEACFKMSSFELIYFGRVTALVRTCTSQFTSKPTL